jgi:hypothetical protein
VTWWIPINPAKKKSRPRYYPEAAPFKPLQFRRTDRPFSQRNASRRDNAGCSFSVKKSCSSRLPASDDHQTPLRNAISRLLIGYAAKLFCCHSADEAGGVSEELKLGCGGPYFAGFTIARHFFVSAGSAYAFT